MFLFCIAAFIYGIVQGIGEIKSGCNGTRGARGARKMPERCQKDARTVPERCLNGTRGSGVPEGRGWPCEALSGLV